MNHFSIKKILFSIPALAIVCGLVWHILSPYFGAVYSYDSYAYLMLGSNFWSGHGFTMPVIRDFHMLISDEFLISSRSFPPLLPMVFGLMDKITNSGLASGLFINLLVIYFCFVSFGNYIQTKSKFAPWIVFFLLPLFVLNSKPLIDEIASGRSIPFTLLFVLILLKLSENEKKSTLSTLSIGFVLGLLYLTRFDTVVFCFLFLGYYWFQTSRRNWTYTAISFFLTVSPWFIRNLVTFGTPLASDNSLTALSTIPSIVPICYFSDKIPLIFDNPNLWFAQRLNYLVINVKTTWMVLADAVGYVAPLCVLGFFISLFKGEGTEKIRLFSVLWIIGNLTCVSLTSYHDYRYFIISAFLIALVSLLFLFNILQNLFGSEQSNTKSDHKSQISGRTVLIVALILFGFTYSLKDQIFQPDKKASTAETMVSEFRNFIPPKTIVASQFAEPLAFYSGWKTIYLPLNIEKMDTTFFEYMNKFKIEFAIIAERSKLAQSINQPILAKSEGFILIKRPGVSP